MAYKRRRLRRDWRAASRASLIETRMAKMMTTKNAVMRNWIIAMTTIP